MRGPITRVTAYARWIVLVLLVGFAVPVLAQNTKGERPVGNKDQIRETKSKSVKRKDKSKTRDIAGRRLRTKNKSSANSANVGMRQPNPYAKRPRANTDRASKPRNRTYAESPSERRKAPTGDISGHRLRTKKPTNSEAASPNVYHNPRYMEHAKTSPGHESPPRYKSTASGQPVVRRVPQQKERAWTGDLRGKPRAAPRSVTAQRQNTFPQDKTYSRYVDKRVPRDRAMSNQREVNRTGKLSQTPKTKGPGGGYATSKNKGFVQRGRKNVYWGKFSKGEKPITRDLTGAPLRTKNYRSPSAGLVGRDTLKHFGRKPGGDVTFAGKRPESVSVGKPHGQKGWSGDISGRRLRRITPSNQQEAGANVFPRRLSATRSGEHAGRPLPSAPISTKRRGETAGSPLRGRPPGIGGMAIAGDLRRTKGKEKKGVPGAKSVSGFSGHMQSGKNFTNQGEGFTGYIKAKRPWKGGGSVSGKLWNNNNSAITQRSLPAGSDRPGSFSGNLKGDGKMFTSQGEDFTGYIKAKRPLKGGGSVSGQLWNNRNAPIDHTTLAKGSNKPAKFSGNMQGGKTFKPQGEGFTGYIKVKKDKMEVRGGTYAGNVKAKKEKKGGGESISGDLWNNQGKSITELDKSGATRDVSDFSGKNKTSSAKPSTAGFDSKGKFRTKVDFTQSPKAVSESMKKHSPNKDGFRIEGKMNVLVKKEKVSDREHTVRGALPGVGPYRNTVRAVEYSSGARKPDRKHNPNSADEAMAGYYFGKSNVGAFHGNMKVKKFQGNDSQPDAKFAHGKDNNVDEERTIFTNVKLLWAKLFNKSGSQPSSVKNKERRPRYDKGEIGMWAE